MHTPFTCRQYYNSSSSVASQLFSICDVPFMFSSVVHRGLAALKSLVRSTSVTKIALGWVESED